MHLALLLAASLFAADFEIKDEAQFKKLFPPNAKVERLAAYNAGSGAVQKYNGVPPYRETQLYVNRIIEAYRKTLQ